MTIVPMQQSMAAQMSRIQALLEALESEDLIVPHSSACTEVAVISTRESTIREKMDRLRKRLSEASAKAEETARGCIEVNFKLQKTKAELSGHEDVKKSLGELKSQLDREIEALRALPKSAIVQSVRDQCRPLQLQLDRLMLQWTKTVKPEHEFSASLNSSVNFIANPQGHSCRQQ